MDTGLERIARLEAQFQHMNQTVDRMALRVDEMHSLLLKARGAQWVLIIVAATIGFVLSKLTIVSGWLGVLPR
jgi:hypothetical protein